MSADEKEESTMEPKQASSPRPVMDPASTSPNGGPAPDALSFAEGQAERRASHIRESLDHEMLDVKDGVLRMGSMVEEQILCAHDALMNRDAALATQVIAGDRRVNEVQRAVSALVGMTIATQAPVARDLRFLLALDRVTYELERMGDHAGSVAKQARKLAGNVSMVTYDELTPMATLAARQVRDVVMALVDIDEKTARQVAARDDEIDRLYHQVFDDVLAEMRTDPAKVDPGTRILFAAHYLERIGDRVTNIAEDVVFLATGEVEDLNP
jgi:phosphate transport system protein